MTFVKINSHTNMFINTIQSRPDLFFLGTSLNQITILHRSGLQIREQHME